jgi:hypothetical protein
MSITANGPLHLVLFGLPRAGKSSLLAALAQVQESQPTLLPGKIEDPAGELARLRQVHYDEAARPTDVETVTYNVRLPSTQGPLDAILIDGAGKFPYELLKKRTPLEEAAGTLPQAVLDADALLLVADASLKQENADKVLAALDAFLRRHEQSRGRRSDVVGLPVFLVLTKCDLLAQEGDTFADWMRRVEEQKRQAHQRLQDFLDDAARTRPHAFGRLEVHVWATAAGRPALGANPPRPKEPYGVVELFGLALNEANVYRQRVERSDARLSTTIRGLSGLAAALAVLTGVLLAGLGRGEPNELQRHIDRYKALEGKALADRLHDYPPDLERRLKELTGFRTDERFPTLTDESRAYVKGRIEELNRYLPYLLEVLKPRFSTPAQDDDELNEREKILREQLPLPEPDWDSTGAGVLRKQALDDIALLRRREEKAVEWYQRLYSRGIRLRDFLDQEQTGRSINWRGWQREMEDFRIEAQKPPDDFSDLPAHSLVTPLAIMRLERVRNARASILGDEDDSTARGGLVQEMEDIRDIAAALGLVPETIDRPALLVIPEKRRGDLADFPFEAAWDRWRRLEPHPELVTSLLGETAGGPYSFLNGISAFPPTHPLVPPYFFFHSTFRLDHVPPVAQESVRVRARDYRDDVLRLLADQWRKTMESIARDHAPDTLPFWKELGRQLKDSPEPRQPYRRLATVLDRLSRLDGDDPVAELLAFLDKPQYTINVRGVSLSVPLDTNVSIGDRAVLTIRCGGEEHRFPLDPGRTDRDDVNLRRVYSFTGSASLILRPGEECEAKLPLRNDEQLTWYGKPNSPFAFLALSAAPVQHETEKPPARGSKVRNAGLKFDTDARLPTAPELLKVLQAVRPIP